MPVLTDEDLKNERWHYQFVHNIMGDFVKSILDYFVAYLYPRFSSLSSIVGTYDKAVIYLKQQQEENRELDKPILPALILNPTGEFDIADANTGAKQPWRFPNIAPGLISRIFEPIYQDKNVLINVGFTRLKGELELILLLNSFYEYFDIKILLLQIFGGIGTNRIINPVIFDSFMILPNELYVYNYSNSIEGTNYTLDWNSCSVRSQVIPTTNRTEYVYPCKIKPQLTLSSMGDSSERYGAEDSLSEWKLSATIGYEVEIPTFVTLRSDYMFERLLLNIRTGMVYSSYEDFNISQEQLTSIFQYNNELESGSNSEISLPESSDKVGDRTLIFRNRYFHIITESEALVLSDNTSYIEVELLEEITDFNTLIINSKNGELTYSEHYDLITETNSVRIYAEYVTLEEDDILEIYVFEIKEPKLSVTINITTEITSLLTVI